MTSVQQIYLGGTDGIYFYAVLIIHATCGIDLFCFAIKNTIYMVITCKLLFLYVLESQIYRIIVVCNGGQLSVWITLRMGTKEMQH